jgi:transglutaminase-like putative cysteine protease
MQLIPKSDNLSDYLNSSDILDLDNSDIQKIAQQLRQNSSDEIDLAKNIFEYVRDTVPHSFDIDGKVVTCKASDVLRHGEGICYAKSHLLAAMMRSVGIPAGFCYQLLVFDDADPQYMTLHGLNAIYLKSLNKWIRLDSRGNKAGVDAQFSVDEEKLAFPVRKEFAEQDYPLIYVNPNDNVVSALCKAKSVQELRENLPVEL